MIKHLPNRRQSFLTFRHFVLVS